MRSLSFAAMEGDSRSALFHVHRFDPNPRGLRRGGRLRMIQSQHSDATSFSHQPVMLDEVVAYFRDLPNGVVVDATLGGAGHAAALLEVNPGIQLVGIDQDVTAIEAATARLAKYCNKRAAIVQCRFDAFVDAAESAFPRTPIVGVLFDLGVSSPQLDVASRGFSYREDGPLDMRMDRDSPTSAHHIVNAFDELDLELLLRSGGEERFAGRIASAIVKARPITTTHHLAVIIRSAIPAPLRRKGGDPSKRSFQAIRIAVNDELNVFARTLDLALTTVVGHGRIVVLSYHSGEDRITKERMRNAASGGCTCIARIGCVCGATPSVKLLARGAKKPSRNETMRNPRAKSARLRACEVLQKDAI